MARWPLALGGLPAARARSPPYLSSLSEIAPALSETMSLSTSLILTLLLCAVREVARTVEGLDNLDVPDVRVGVVALLPLFLFLLPSRFELSLTCDDHFAIVADRSSSELSAFR